MTSSTVAAARRLGRLGVFGAAVVWVAGLWNPFYVDAPVPGAPAFERDRVAQLVVDAGGVGPALVDGVRVVQEVLVPTGLQQPEAGTTLEACVSLSFATYGRTNPGEVIVMLDGGDMSERFVVPAATLQDWRSESFCLVDVDAGSFDGRLTVGLHGRGAAGADEAVSPLIRTAADGERGGLIAPAAVVAPDGSAAAASGPLGLRATIDHVTMTEGEPAPLLDRLLRWALPLGLPMVIAILAVVILSLDLTARATSRATAEAPAGRSDMAQHVRSHRPMQVIAGSLVLAGVLVLTVGLRPALGERSLVSLDPDRPGRAPASDLRLDAATTIEQNLQLTARSPSADGDEVPDAAAAPEGQLCVAVPLRAQHTGTHASAGTILLTLIPAGGGGTGTADGGEGLVEPVALADVEGDRTAVCFDVTPAELELAGGARLVLQGDGLTQGSVLEIGSRAAGAGEPPARTVSPGGTTIETRAVDVTYLRELPSYRQRLLTTIGSGALIIGAALLLGTGVVARLHRRPRWIQAPTTWRLKRRTGDRAQRS